MFILKVMLDGVGIRIRIIIIKHERSKLTFSFGKRSSLQAIYVQAIGNKSNGQTIFISCCTEKSIPYLSAIDFSRNMILKIIDSLNVVGLPIVHSSSDAILYEQLVA